MPASLVEGDTILALDVGAATTRALLFDVVEGRYYFVSAASVPTTVEAPLRNLAEGVRQAIEQLQSITGRVFLNNERRLIVPSRAEDGSGVDGVVATLSAGAPLRTVVAGLLPEISLESALALAESTYARVGETLSLADPRSQDRQLDALIRLRPELVILAGGTDGGAWRSVERLFETVGLACYRLPPDLRPAILFAGNQKLAGAARSALEPHALALHVSPNLRPTIDMEDLEPARRELARVLIQVRKRQFKGLDELEAWTGGRILPSAYARGRMMRFLSQIHGGPHGLLSVDLGASAATIAAAFGGSLTLGVYPQFGLGEYLPELLRRTELAEVTRWLMLDIPEATVRDYVYQKSLYPYSLPATREEQAIEQCIARQALLLTVQSALQRFPTRARFIRPGLLPSCDPILAGGGILTGTPNPGQAALMLLDGLQPTGISHLILDQNNLLAALGAAAEINNLMPVHVLESGAFLRLATVISPVSDVHFGTPVLRARLVRENGNESRVEVKAGSIEILPLPPGEEARLELQPYHRADVGFGPGRGGRVSVIGSALGVVLDARGRPLSLPADPVRRRELIKKWLWTMGG